MTHDVPATKGELERLRKELRPDMDGLRQDMAAMKDEILRHFDLTVETIRHDLQGANCDEIELLKDGSRDHERRIRRLERSSGVA